MSPLPISRSQLDRLGERLAAGEITIADDELLQAVLAAYDTAMAVAEGVVAGAGYRPTARLKTTGTLVEKLRREQGMKLKGVQDIAGLRIVLENGEDQDAAVARLREAFEDATGSEVRVTDRRANPSHGYRAVHLIPKVDGLPVEVQVRTYFQDLWAQGFESLADRWGRQIRYGGAPNPPREDHGSAGDRRDHLVDLFKGDLSEILHKMDTALAAVAITRRQLEDMYANEEADEEIFSKFALLDQDVDMMTARVTTVLKMMASIERSERER